MQLTYDMVVDPDHYHVEAVDSPHGSYDVIVREGNRLRRQPIVTPVLYEKFAACEKTPESVIAFCNEYGLPRGIKSIRLEEVYQMIDVVRCLLAAAEAEDWISIGAWLAENSNVVQIFCHLGYDPIPGQVIDTDSLRPRLEFKPRNLISFIYCQLIQDKSSGKQYKLCIRAGCGEYFYYGPGTSPPKRNTALYCTEKCQKAHAYEKRKGLK